jgi:hypothetical protein
MKVSHHEFFEIIYQTINLQTTRRPRLNSLEIRVMDKVIKFTEYLEALRKRGGSADQRLEICSKYKLESFSVSDIGASIVLNEASDKIFDCFLEVSIVLNFNELLQKVDIYESRVSLQNVDVVGVVTSLEKIFDYSVSYLANEDLLKRLNLNYLINFVLDKICQDASGTS